MKMRLKPLFYSLLFLFLFLLESCTGPVFRDLNPGYLLAGVVCLALLEGERWGAIFGVIFGLLRDFAVGSLFGLYGILFLVFGYGLGFLSKTVLSSNIFTCLLTGTLACGLCEVLSFFCESALVSVSGSFAARTVLFPKLVMNFIVCVPIYFLLRWIRAERRSDRRKRRRV